MKSRYEMMMQGRKTLLHLLPQEIIQKIKDWYFIAENEEKFFIPAFALEYSNTQTAAPTMAYFPQVKKKNYPENPYTIHLYPYLVQNTTETIQQDSQIWVWACWADFDNHAEEDGTLPLEPAEFKNKVNAYLSNCISLPTLLVTSQGGLGFHAIWLFSYKNRPCFFSTTFQNKNEILVTLQTKVFSYLLQHPHTDYNTLLSFSTEPSLSGKKQTSLISFSLPIDIETIFSEKEISVTQTAIGYEVNILSPIKRKKTTPDITKFSSYLNEENFTALKKGLKINEEEPENNRLIMKDVIQLLDTLGQKYSIEDGHKFSGDTHNGYAHLETIKNNREVIGYRIIIFASRQLFAPIFSGVYVLKGKTLPQSVVKISNKSSGNKSYIEILQSWDYFFSSGSSVCTNVYWRSLEIQESSKMHQIDEEEYEVIYVKILNMALNSDMRGPQSIKELKLAVSAIARSHPISPFICLLDGYLEDYRIRGEYNPAKCISDFWPHTKDRLEVEILLKNLVLMTISQAILGSHKIIVPYIESRIGENVKFITVNEEGTVEDSLEEVKFSTLVGQAFCKYFFFFFAESDIGKTYFKSLLLSPISDFVWKLQGSSKSAIGERDYAGMVNAHIVDHSELKVLNGEDRRQLKLATDPQIASRRLYEEIKKHLRGFILFMDSNVLNAFNAAETALLNRAYSFPEITTPLLFCRAIKENPIHPERNPQLYEQLPQSNLFKDLWAWGWDVISKGKICTVLNENLAKKMLERNKQAEDVPEIVRELLSAKVNISWDVAKAQPNKYIRLFSTTVKGLLLQYASRVRGVGINDIMKMTQNDLELSKRKLAECGIAPDNTLSVGEYDSQTGYLVIVVNINCDSAIVSKIETSIKIQKLISELNGEKNDSDSGNKRDSYI